MFFPVDKSIIVSAPNGKPNRFFNFFFYGWGNSTVPNVIILTKKLRPTIIGSLSGWLMLLDDDVREQLLNEQILV
jgi:hypothetical protein